ncbi:MAG: hypothetical protein P1P88_10145 [Bacteroidales bacterium]|nr:hypothetical protein [Bacteroidales bacterium]
MKKSAQIILSFVISLFILPVHSLIAQPESSVDKKLFEIQSVHHGKSKKKKISVKDKKIRITIRSSYDMGNATLELFLNDKKVSHQLKEIGTESAGSKVKVVTGVIYEITVECQQLLEVGENELLIKGYGIPQRNNFKIKG